MEKINIAELLKDCPKGMELDCTMYDNLEFDHIDVESQYPVKCRAKITDVGYNSHEFTEYGRPNFYSNAKCVIFPKGKTTWEGFVPHCQFKNGDIITDDVNGPICIYKNEGMLGGTVDYHCGVLSSGDFKVKNEKNPKRHFGYIKNYRFATEEEKQKLFDAIKAHGYYWNAETKTLEKLIELKEDTNDKTVMSGIYFDREYYADEVELHLNNYEIKIRDGKTYAIFKNQETKILKPKFKVGDRIRKKGDYISGYITIIDIDNFYKVEYDGGGVSYVNVEAQDDWELIPNKFDITTLVPFESRVLVRSTNEGLWKPAIYGFSHQNGYYVVGGACWKQCIPYKGNEYLCGTTDNCNNFYKTWEE